MNDITAYSGTPASGKMPHNGKLLKAFVESHHLTQVNVARRMGVTASTLPYYYKSHSLTMDVWWRASKALHYNFLSGLGSLLSEKYVTPDENELKATCERLQKENEQLKMELEMYKHFKTSLMKEN
jgi:transcriptional regulator with XRE-family HTH domain